MNAYTLIQDVQQRVSGYDPTEYLREINDAYQEIWDYILQLDDSYFTDIKTLTVADQNATEFDFLYNTNNALSSPLSVRYFQIDRIRVLQPGQSNWFAAQPRPWNDQQFLMLQQLNPPTQALNAPYLYNPFAKASVRWAQPFPVGTQIEVVYSFIFLPLTAQSDGNVTTSGVNVAGINTSFTQVIGPDFQAGLPGNDQDTDIGLEFVFPNNQIYRVKTVTSDTAATTINTISPVRAESDFVLAMVPDIPEGHHRIISTVATRNMMSLFRPDQLPFWAAKADKDIDRLRDTIMTRQRQAPARRQRFSQSVLRYQIAPPGR